MRMADLKVKDKYLHFQALSRAIRKVILDLVHRTGSPHIGPSFSMVELLTVLYFEILKIDPSHPDESDRDRFILSKGHAVPALYAVLAERGFIGQEDLAGFAVNGGVLEQHPNRDVGRGIELSTGSLGHGLSVAAGMALAAKRDGRPSRVFVLLGDGELNEGSVWEAAMFASHHGLDNLTAIVDYNKMQALGRTEDIIRLDSLSQKWSSFGWTVMEVDGHDVEQVSETLNLLPFTEGHPNALIAHTVKGKGVSFMEDSLLWHYRAPNDNEYGLALKELGL
jgi:transketolase